MRLPQLIQKLLLGKKKPQVPREITLPDNLFVQCPQCKATLYRRRLSAHADVCPECGHHFVLSVAQWIALLTDRKSWRPLFADLRPVDPLSFPHYADKLKLLMANEKEESVSTGHCRIQGIPLLVGVMNPNFLMGSLGGVAGEKLTRLFELATAERKPVLLVVRSGGARMQEGVLSLMQMAKVSAAIRRFSDAGLLYIALLTHPTTGGVSASFAMLGDIILAEPGALIGFAGPRVIEQTIRQKLPEGFQKSEFVLEKGFLDAIVPRHELRSTLAHLLELHTFHAPPESSSKGTSSQVNFIHRVKKWLQRL
ncbi:MAG TPA: acetyl-CoA carboxylase, carboxyltransferase subunit beta [Fibrobacteraceae bacterium]|nr:acetyl-CoA carboxylase, carboxyltransferase subunit beta [Fibrobacteraceae bacterium]